MARRSTRRVWHTMANAVVVAYLATAVSWLAAGGVSAEPGWLFVHLLLLGAATNAIVAWTAHFTAALLQQPQPAVPISVIRLGALNVAILAVLVGVQADLHALVVAGVALLAGVIGVHASLVARAIATSHSKRFAPTVRYYVVAAIALVLGAIAGAAMAVGVSERWQQRLLAAHLHLNLLGWVTLTVLGTQFSLWPTALRTRMVQRWERAARTCLVACTCGLAATVTGLLTAVRPVTVVGLLLYLAGVAVFLDPFVRTARQRAPHSAATWFLAASTGWLIVAVVCDVAMVIATPAAGRLSDRLQSLVPWFVAGFVVQVLLGALTYLLPVVLGGSPSRGRRMATVLEGWAWPRLAVLNAGVVLLALPSDVAHRVGWASVGLVVITFVALVVAVTRR